MRKHFWIQSAFLTKPKIPRMPLAAISELSESWPQSWISHDFSHYAMNSQPFQHKTNFKFSTHPAIALLSCEPSDSTTGMGTGKARQWCATIFPNDNHQLHSWDCLQSLSESIFILSFQIVPNRRPLRLSPIFQLSSWYRPQSNLSESIFIFILYLSSLSPIIIQSNLSNLYPNHQAMGAKSTPKFARLQRNGKVMAFKPGCWPLNPRKKMCIKLVAGFNSFKTFWQCVGLIVCIFNYFHDVPIKVYCQRLLR